MAEPVGSFCLVLHTHLPWVAHHGTWPVGEEWLHQAWSASYLRVIAVLTELAGEGRQDLLTMGVTPILAAQLDDPYCLNEQRIWLGNWQLRAQGMAGSREAWRRDVGAREFREASLAQHQFDGAWQRGASPVLRQLADDGVIEILGGPATHVFAPLATSATREFGLKVGQDDSLLRRGSRPTGIWAPECAYMPGLEQEYARAGITHFMVDGPTMNSAGRSTGSGWSVGSSDVIAFARDLDVTYRVWSPRKGYPGGKWYRDFHSFDHEWGFKPFRVTSTTTPSEQKAPYDRLRAVAAVERDAMDFVRVVRGRLLDISARSGGPALVVAAYDTELFGHWWHEGPQWLARVLRLLPENGVTVTTLSSARENGHVSGRVDLPMGSWGSGKDWRVWAGESVRDVVEANSTLEHEVLDVISKYCDDPGNAGQRSAALDQLARELLLSLASDWAFMITKDSASSYARERIASHTAVTRKLMRLISSGDALGATRYATSLSGVDGPFGHLDARALGSHHSLD